MPAATRPMVMLLPVRLVLVEGVDGLRAATVVPVAAGPVIWPPAVELVPPCPGNDSVLAPPDGAAVVGAVPEGLVWGPTTPCQVGGTHSLDADELVVKPRRTRNIFMPSTCSDGENLTRYFRWFRVS